MGYLSLHISTVVVSLRYICFGSCASQISWCGRSGLPAPWTDAPLMISSMMSAVGTLQSEFNEKHTNTKDYAAAFYLI